MSLTILVDAPAMNHAHSPAHVVLQSSVIDVGHKVLIEVSPGGNKWALYTDRTGKVIFDLSKFVKNQFREWELSLPYNASPELVVNWNMCPIINVTMQDVDDVSPATLGNYSFVYGGVSWEKYVMGGWFSGDFMAASPIYPFMTFRNKSRKKYTTKTAVEFLSYFAVSETIVKVCIQAFNHLDTPVYNDLMPLTDALSGPYYTRLFRFGVGFGHVDYSSLFDINEIRKFRIFLTSKSGVPLSEDRWYYLDPRVHKFSHQFLYLNSLGGIDTLFVNNDIKMKVKSTRSVVSRYANFPYTASQGTRVGKNVELENIFSASYFPDSDYERLLFQEMIASRRVWKYEDGILKPVIITSGEVPFDIERGSTEPVEFDYELGYVNTQVTPGNNW